MIVNWLFGVAIGVALETKGVAIGIQGVCIR